MKEIPLIIIGLPLVTWYVTKLYYKGNLTKKDDFIGILEKQIGHLNNNTQGLPKETEKSLKESLHDLSNSITLFIAKCEEDDLLLHDILEDYRVHYNDDVVILYEQAKEQGYSDDILDNIYRRPPTVRHMSTIAKKLRVVANKMPNN